MTLPLTFEVLPGVLIRVRAVVPAVHLVATELNARDVLDLGDLFTLTLERCSRRVEAGVVVLYVHLFEPALVRRLSTTSRGIIVIVKRFYPGSRDPLV